MRNHKDCSSHDCSTIVQRDSGNAQFAKSRWRWTICSILFVNTSPSNNRFLISTVISNGFPVWILPVISMPKLYSPSIAGDHQTWCTMMAAKMTFVAPKRNAADFSKLQLKGVTIGKNPQKLLLESQFELSWHIAWHMESHVSCLQASCLTYGSPCSDVVSRATRLHFETRSKSGCEPKVSGRSQGKTIDAAKTDQRCGIRMSMTVNV